LEERGRVWYLWVLRGLWESTYVERTLPEDEMEEVGLDGLLVDAGGLEGGVAMLACQREIVRWYCKAAQL
jgi:hypothetical protein